MMRVFPPLALALCLALVACDGGGSVDDNPVQPAPSTLKIGLLTSKTGSGASLGRHVEYSARLALKEINAAGGVNGQQVELLVRDDKLDADIGVQGARELAATDAIGIIGSFSSRVSIPVAQQVTINAGMALITSGSSPLITTLDDRDTVWRTVASDVLQGAALADRMLSEGLRRVAVANVDDAFGQGLANSLRNRLTARGGELLTQVAYPSGKTLGFESEAAQLTAAGVPDAILIVGFAVDAANLVRALRERLGDRIPRLFGAGNFGTAFLDNVGTAGLGVQVVSPTAPRASGGYQRFRANFVREVGEEPEATAHTGYDAVYLLALALAQARHNSRAAVLANLRSISRGDSPRPTEIGVGEFAKALAAIARNEDIDYHGVGGQLDFDANGDPANGTYLINEVVLSGNGTLGFTERVVLTFP
ncbi:ABC transporter substrate-binding protein [Chitinimonas lacunae]|uniref:ABC transporter substrate-binding protein n=1 Tax=Chitinimonas lacunae TaxID=1963018 RepID=A0ABV8MUD7_9NEIS